MHYIKTDQNYTPITLTDTELKDHYERSKQKKEHAIRKAQCNKALIHEATLKETP